MGVTEEGEQAEVALQLLVLGELRTIVEIGDVDEAFYSGVISVFSDGLKMLSRCEESVVSKLLPRFEEAIHATAGMGWGFHDSLRDTFAAYVPNA